MPLDFSIPLNAQVPQIQSPFAILQDVMQVRSQMDLSRQRQLQEVDRRRQLAGDDAVRRVLQGIQTKRGGMPDYETAAQQLQRMGFGPEAMKVMDKAREWQKEQAQTMRDGLTDTQQRLSMAAKLLRGVGFAPDKQSAYGQVAPKVRDLVGPELGAAVPDEWDEAKVETMLAWGETADETLKRRNEVADKLKRDMDAAEGGRKADEYWLKRTAQWVSTINPGPNAQTDLENALGWALNTGGSAAQAAIASIGNKYSPELVERAKVLSGEKKEVNLQPQKLLIDGKLRTVVLDPRDNRLYDMNTKKRVPETARIEPAPPERAPGSTTPTERERDRVGRATSRRSSDLNELTRRIDGQDVTSAEAADRLQLEIENTYRKAVGESELKSLPPEMSRFRTRRGAATSGLVDTDASGGSNWNPLNWFGGGQQPAANPAVQTPAPGVAPALAPVHAAPPAPGVSQVGGAPTGGAFDVAQVDPQVIERVKTLLRPRLIDNKPETVDAAVRGFLASPQNRRLLGLPN